MELPATVPAQLPLLPLHDQVLLPTAVLQLHVPKYATRSVALLQALCASGRHDALVAALPPVLDKAAGAVSTTPHGENSTPHHHHHSTQLQNNNNNNNNNSHLELDIATAARILQTSCVVATGDWVVLLEGVARVALDSAPPPPPLLGVASPPSDAAAAGYDVVSVTLLEPSGPWASKVAASTSSSSSSSSPSAGGAALLAYTPLPSPTSATSQSASSVATVGNSSSGGSAAEAASLQELGQRLKLSTTTLLRIITASAAASGSPAGAATMRAVRRLVEAMRKLPSWRAADSVASVLAQDPKERLEVLRAVDPLQRIRLAVAMVEAALGKLGAASAAGSSSSSGGGGGGGGGGPPGSAVSPTAAAAQRARWLPQYGGGGGFAWPPGMYGIFDDDDGGAVAGNGGPEDEVEGLLRQIQAANPPGEVLAAAVKEARRLRMGGEQQPGYGPGRAYLELLAELPWSKLAGATDHAAAGAGVVGSGIAPPALPPVLVPLARARQLLDAAHHGLDPVKRRLVEYLAVRRLKGATARAPVLCFVGPPGVGKTSLAKSIAEVLGRPYVRIALGGVRDEAEIRGHRRTYVGALPGRVLQGLRRAGCKDPVMLLDELDKVGGSGGGGGGGAGGGGGGRGDPSAALLEVLDPEQNGAFVDTYLGLPFDLSRVTFLATANRLQDMPPPLRDRLEIIELGGYSREEKVAIATAHLLPSLTSDHGLHPHALSFTPDVLGLVIDRYTREAGVRQLSRCLAALARHVAVSIVTTADQAAAAAVAAEAEAAAFGTQAAQQEQLLPALSPHQQQQVVSADLSAAEASSLMRDVRDSATEPPPAPTARLQAAYSAAFAAARRRQDSGSSTRGAAEGALHQQQRQPQPPPHLHDGASIATSSSSSGSVGGRKLQRASAEAAASASADQLQQQPASRRLFSTPAEAARTGAAGGGGGGVAASSSMATTAHDMEPPPQAGPPYPPDLLGSADALRVVVTPELVEAVLGPPVYDNGVAELAERLGGAGVAAGLVWTVAGGAVQYVECCRVGHEAGGAPGSLMLTGQVGDVLGESARIALSWIRSHAPTLGLLEEGTLPLPLGAATAGTGGDCAAAAAAEPGVQTVQPLAMHTAAGCAAVAAAVGDCGASSTAASFSALPSPPPSGALRLSNPANSWNVHVHFPAGAQPKDGPSAGITLAVALLSLFSGRPVRPDTALTGELTLRGVVLPVGGIKEKLLAARQAGLRRVVVPAGNMRHVTKDMPEEVRSALTIVPVGRLEEALAAAFDPPYLLAPKQARL